MNLIDVLNWMDTASADDLKRVSEQLRFKQSMNAHSFKPGDPVKFAGKRGYGMMHGVFVKHLTKNVEVLVDGARWRVHPSLIQPDTNPPKLPTSSTPKYTFTPIAPPPATPTTKTTNQPAAPAALQSFGDAIKEKINAPGS